MAGASPASSSSTLVATGAGLGVVTPLRSSRYEPVKESTLSTSEKAVKLRAGRHSGKGKLDSYMHRWDDLPSGWQQYIHPDGKPYFRHAVWNVVTEVNVREPTLFRALQSWHARVMEVWGKRKAADGQQHPQRLLEGDAELYLALEPEGYYLVDHASQDVFWLDDVELRDLSLDDEPCGMSFELFILRNYYRHLENFPCHNDLPSEAMEFLRGSLTYTCTDHLTSKESATTPWNAEEAKTFIDLLQGLEDSENESSRSATSNSSPKNGLGIDISEMGFKTWFVARLICVILHSRLVHRHGMFDAQTDRLADVKVPRSSLDMIVGALSFYAHFTYLERLENVWADGIVSFIGWQGLINSLLMEWSDSNLLATVVLSANMAFLALSELEPYEITSSVVSTFFSIGSIATGLHHVWRHRDKRDSGASQAGIYFRNASRSSRNLKMLAFFLSLPLIMLSWSLVAFASSVTMYAFRRGTPWRSYVISGVFLTTVVAAVLSTTFFFWDIFSIRSRRWGFHLGLR